MENEINNKAGIFLKWIETILFKILDSMKIISETSVNIIVFAMFCAVLSYIAWGKSNQEVEDVKNRCLDVDTVKNNVDSVTLKLQTR